MRIIKKEKNAIILNLDIYSITQTATDMYAIWSSCNSHQKGKAGRPKGSRTQAISRTDNNHVLKKTFKYNRNLINCNFTGKQNELFITLTYGDRSIKGVSGAKQFSKDFDLFIHKLKYLTFNGNMKKATKYLLWFVALEPQGSGVWHAHILVKWLNRERIFIDPFTLAKIWGKGYVKANHIDNISNIGAYLSAYLTDVVIDPEQALRSNTQTKWTRRHEHMVEKGARLAMYPAGVRLCRHSRNLNKPDHFYMNGKDLKELLLVEGWKLTGCQTVEIETNTIQQDPYTGELSPLIITIKQFYYQRDPEVAQKFKLVKKLAFLRHVSVAEVLATLGTSSINDFILN